MIKSVHKKTPDDAYAEACFYLEKELGCDIGPEYPAAKFIQQLEELNKHNKKKKKEFNKGNSGNETFG